MEQIASVTLQVEHLREFLGIGYICAASLMDWQKRLSRTGIRVAMKLNPILKMTGRFHRTGRVESDQSVLVPGLSPAPIP